MVRLLLFLNSFTVTFFGYAYLEMGDPIAGWITCFGMIGMVLCLNRIEEE